jgi:hypothetical protein
MQLPKTADIFCLFTKLISKKNLHIIRPGMDVRVRNTLTYRISPKCY